ncbi:nitrilase-related carbon-nitrogen hydrolase [Candidatus Phytoplasma pini]|uniref:Glutamine-dependent NAD(+) synthetase n=1 Tax=Candidatus Phytoplasma pini TaxID=267362 RepID=A0A559KJC5_9MOLU|nr:nitrilase-related carbon-nitrogen hydrolase [Candidatus Phytoplasma pini]TVY12233.1 glutamine-dependent NAD(+) synthetase [Candidatus Phytoplasma pini]
MYKDGFLKVELATPPIYTGNPFKNAQNIISVLNKTQASFVLFSELCLSGYKSKDLFFEKTFLEENLKALSFMIQNNIFEGIYLIGMPFSFQEILFNVAIVLQKNKILGIVPKQTIPNYKEFDEKRWFQSGKIIPTQVIDFLDQKVQFGNILFKNKQQDIVFGVEICQDLWNIESPSDLLVLNGAHLIFNLSASTEHIGKSHLRKMAVVDHSRKHIGGYFYTSNGVTESSDDILLSNHKIAAMLGDVIGEKDLSTIDDSLIVDVSIDTIKYQRRIDTTYGDQIIGKKLPFFISYFDLNEVDVYKFEDDNFNSKPFVSKDGLKEQLQLINKIQILSFKNKLSFIPDILVIFEMKERLNEFLTFLNIIQSFSLAHKSLEKLFVILREKDFQDKTLLVDVQNILIDCGINNLILNENENYFSENIKNLIEKKYKLGFFNNNLTSQPNKLFLESDNLSEIALGQFQKDYSTDYVYNMNIGLPNTLMVELIRFHLEESKIISIKSSTQKKYLKKIEEFLTQKIIIEDFILFYHLNHNFNKKQIAFLLQKIFVLPFEDSLKLVKVYIYDFYNSQYKRQIISSGPKITLYSLSPRTELKLSIDVRRQEE